MFQIIFNDVLLSNIGKNYFSPKSNKEAEHHLKEFVYKNILDPLNNHNQRMFCNRYPHL